MRYSFSWPWLLIFFSLLSSCENKSEFTITLWNQMRPSGREILDTLLKDFEKKNPPYKIKELYYETEELRSKFVITALGGSGPELIYGPSDSIGPYREMDLILPLDNLLDKSYLKNFDERGLTYLDGHLYQLGDSIGNHLTLVYNKELVPSPPKTLSELLELGKKLTRDTDGDNITDIYALAWNYTEPFFFIPFLGGYGGWILDGNNKPTLNTLPVIKAGQLILDLKSKYRIIPGECDYDLANSLFKQRKAAMIINGPWSWGEYEKAGIKYGITRIPLIDETGLWPTPMVSPLGYSINLNIRKSKLSKTVELLKFLNTNAAQLKFSEILKTLPSRLEAQNDKLVQGDEVLKNSIYQMKTGKPMPVITELRAVWDGMRPAYQALLNGTIDSKTAAANMEKNVKKLIREMRKN